MSASGSANTRSAAADPRRLQGKSAASGELRVSARRPPGPCNTHRPRPEWRRRARRPARARRVRLRPDGADLVPCRERVLAGVVGEHLRHPKHEQTFLPGGPLDEELGEIELHAMVMARASSSPSLPMASTSRTGPNTRTRANERRCGRRTQPHRLKREALGVGGALGARQHPPRARLEIEQWGSLWLVPSGK